MIDEIVFFNRVVLEIQQRAPGLLSEKESAWLIKALQEEVDEFRSGQLNEDLAESVDALLDLIYFAVGGLYRLGLDEQTIRECFLAVHTANLRKKRGVKASRPQDGSVADAVKDESWRDPKEDIERLLNGIR